MVKVVFLSWGDHLLEVLMSSGARISSRPPIWLTTMAPGVSPDPFRWSAQRKSSEGDHHDTRVYQQGVQVRSCFGPHARKRLAASGGVIHYTHPNKVQHRGPFFLLSHQIERVETQTD